MKVDTRGFWRQGWTIVRKVFSRDEIADIRARVFDGLKRTETGAPATDLLADPLLGHLVCDERLLGIARQILGGEPVYFGDATYAVIGRGYDEHSQATGYHRDNTDRSDATAPDWRGRYTLIRFGVYLQDHRRHSGGLMVRSGSHNRIQRGWRTYFHDRYMNTGIGDVAVWNMRLQHSGVGRFWRGFPRLAIPPQLWRVVPALLQSPRWDEERAAVWISYGLDDAHLERHCRYLLDRSERLKAWRHAHYDRDTVALCERRGLKVIDMPRRLRDMMSRGEAVGRHDHHYQLEY